VLRKSTPAYKHRGWALVGSQQNTLPSAIFNLLDSRLRRTLVAIYELLGSLTQAVFVSLHLPLGRRFYQWRKFWRNRSAIHGTFSLLPVQG